jgi:pimeloyl-[acyl-carrier protein] methyl ester esterase
MKTALFCERQDVAAAAAPLVCIHGWGMNLRAFDPLRAALRDEHGSWALDLPGHGRSEWHQERSDLESQLQDIQSALPARCVLVGWSLGGQLALELARRAPLQVRALVLIASTPRFTQAADWPQGLDAQTMHAFAAQLEQDWRQTLRDFVQLQVRGGRNAETTQQQLEAALEAHGLPRMAALRAGLAMLTVLDQRTVLAQIQQPVLVVSGQNDRVTPPAAGHWMAEALPHARHAQIVRAGHAPLLSHVDEVKLAIAGFLGALPRDRQGVAA